MSHDLRPFVDWVTGEFEPSVRVAPAPGCYAAVSGGPPSLYGLADMACVRSTLGAPPPDRAGAAASTRITTTRTRTPATSSRPDGQPRRAARHRLLRGRPHPPRRPSALAPDLRRAVVDAGRDHRVPRLAGLAGLGLPGEPPGGRLGSLAFNVPDLVDAGWWTAYFAGLERHLDPANGMFGDGTRPAGDLDQVGGRSTTRSSTRARRATTAPSRGARRRPSSVSNAPTACGTRPTRTGSPWTPSTCWPGPWARTPWTTVAVPTPSGPRSAGSPRA